ncbi:hypothetical protein TuanDB_32520 [Bacillus anthracis]|uniref:Uncharacterized protein n=1 Tax=Bacillus anthracis TaxID=1392 RepID=A0A640M8D8_BACAN|nr:hypothetical protein TuanDB_32520 [Bacillus anthracis]GEU09935.1 hypothetical protein HG1_54200 [Bacillus anthracis]
MWGAVIPVKTIAQTPILNKIYTKTLKKSSSHPFFSENSFKPLKRPIKGHNLI